MEKWKQAVQIEDVVRVPLKIQRERNTKNSQISLSSDGSR